MERERRIHVACGLGIVLALYLNARQQQVALLSWQTAGLLGIAAAVAAVTYLLVRWVADRGG